MTLQQLKYAAAIAAAGTISEAAQALSIAQPSLTNAMKKLETEVGIRIFMRTNKGVALSREGEEFLAYASRVTEQATLLEEKYKGRKIGKQSFCVSAQHDSFAMNAFADLIRLFGNEAYDFYLRENQTDEIIEDVVKLRSEIGVLCLNEYQKNRIQRILKDRELMFECLFVASPYVCVSSTNPLAEKHAVKPEDLEPYPCLSFERKTREAVCLTEEILNTLKRKKNIWVGDRATLFNLLIDLNGYTICHGIIGEGYNEKDIVAIPLLIEDAVEVGYIVNQKISRGSLCSHYIEALKNHAQQARLSPFHKMPLYYSA